MRVDYGADIRARTKNLGVNRVLGVASSVAVEDLAVPRDKYDVVSANLLKAKS
jgi:hypothetical protein